MPLSSFFVKNSFFTKSFLAGSSLALALFGVVTIPVNSQVGGDCVPFNDVPEGHPFYSYICALRHFRVVSGYPGNLYKPDNYVTRGEMAKFIFNAANIEGLEFNIPENTSCGNFPDVPNGAPFYIEITSLKCANIISGYPQSSGPNVYRPNNYVTRGEMAKFVKNAFEVNTSTSCEPFPDVPNGAPFYEEITSLKCANIISGYPQSSGPNVYRPNNYVTRGELSKFIINTIGL